MAFLDDFKSAMTAYASKVISRTDVAKSAYVPSMV